MFSKLSNQSSWQYNINRVFNLSIQIKMNTNFVVIFYFRLEIIIDYCYLWYFWFYLSMIILCIICSNISLRTRFVFAYQKSLKSAFKTFFLVEIIFLILIVLCNSQYQKGYLYVKKLEINISVKAFWYSNEV